MSEIGSRPDTVVSGGPLDPSWIEDTGTNIIVHAPLACDAQSIAVHAVATVCQRTGDAVMAAARFNYDAALQLLEIESGLREARAAVRMARNGDLDVRRLVLEQVQPDRSWAVARDRIKDSLTSFDERLGIGCLRYKDSPELLSVVTIMLMRLIDEGVLVAYGNGLVGRARDHANEAHLGHA